MSGRGTGIRRTARSPRRTARRIPSGRWNASASASQMVRTSSSRTGRISSPSGSGWSGTILDGRPDHLGHVRDRRVTSRSHRARSPPRSRRPPRPRGTTRPDSWPAAMSRSRASFHASIAPPMPAAAELGVEEADLLVDARAVELLFPEHAAVADGDAVDLGHEEVLRRDRSARGGRRPRRSPRLVSTRSSPSPCAEAVMMRAKSG